MFTGPSTLLHELGKIPDQDRQSKVIRDEKEVAGTMNRRFSLTSRRNSTVLASDCHSTSQRLSGMGTRGHGSIECTT